MSMPAKAKQFILAASDPYAAEAAWYARAVALGASPPAATRAAVLAFFTSFFAAGFALADFDYIYLMIGEASGDTSASKYNQKRVNLVNPGTFDATVVNPNASGHAALGTLGDLSMYWDSGYNSGSAPVSRTGNASSGIVIGAHGTGSADCYAGAIAAPSHIIQGRYAAGQSYYYYGGSAATNLGAPAAAPNMFWGNIITSVKVYNNTTEIFDSATGTEAPSAGSIYLFGFNNSGTPSQRCNVTLSLAWHGRSLSAGERTSWYTMIQTLMAAFGVTI